MKVLGALVAVVACAPAQPPQTRPPYFVEIWCSPVHGVGPRPLRGPLAEKLWACDRDPACSVRCAPEVAKTPSYDAAPGSLCPIWGRIEGGEMQAIGDIHRAWCAEYDLSPETCWCLTNEQALREQRAAYEAACASGVPDTAEAVLDAKLRECRAYLER